MLINYAQQFDYSFRMVIRKNYIKKLRAERDLSTAGLAELVNTTPQQISNLELGKRKLTWEWIMRLSDALQCHPLELVDDGTPPIQPDEKDLLDNYRGLQEAQKRMFSHMLEAAAEKEPPNDQPTPTKKDKP